MLLQVKKIKKHCNLGTFSHNAEINVCGTNRGMWYAGFCIFRANLTCTDRLLSDSVIDLPKT